MKKIVLFILILWAKTFVQYTKIYYVHILP